MDPLLLLPLEEMDERLAARVALDAAEEHLRSLCASHAATFVKVERRAEQVESLLRDLELAIASLVQDHVIPCNERLQMNYTLVRLSENHQLRRRTLLQHSFLLEILELPSLMDACIRSSLYNEALQIASFFVGSLVPQTDQYNNNTTTTNNNNNNTAAVVLLRVQQQIHQRTMELHKHLVLKLQTNLSMPECLEVVTCLKRLQSISNTTTTTTHDDDDDDSTTTATLSLQLDFLEARNVWLQSGLEEQSSLLDTIEHYRARIFEICTQYHAIFQVSNTKSNNTHFQNKNNSILAMYMCRRIHSFLELIRSHTFDNSASLRDAWEASVFFSTSLGRLGTDFTPLVGKIFETKMHTLVTAYWKNGLQTLEETLQICRQAGVASPLVSTTAMVETTTTTQSSSSSFSTSSTLLLLENGQPPRVLLTLPPLGRLVNAVLEGLNEVRRCLFPGLCVRLRRAMDTFLQDTNQVVELHQRAVHTPGLRGEATLLRQVAQLLVERMTHVVEPYLRGALELSLGNSNQAKVFFDKVQESLEEDDEGAEEEEEPAVEEKDDDVNKKVTLEGDAGKEEKPTSVAHHVAPATVTDVEEDADENVGQKWGDVEDDVYG